MPEHLTHYKRVDAGSRVHVDPRKQHQGTSHIGADSLTMQLSRRALSLAHDARSTAGAGRGVRPSIPLDSFMAEHARRAAVPLRPYSPARAAAPVRPGAWERNGSLLDALLRSVAICLGMQQGAPNAPVGSASMGPLFTPSPVKASTTAKPGWGARGTVSTESFMMTHAKTVESYRARPEPAQMSLGYGADSYLITHAQKMRELTPTKVKAPESRVTDANSLDTVRAGQLFC